MKKLIRPPTLKPGHVAPPAQWSDHCRFGPGEWRSVPREFRENTGWRALNAGCANGDLVVANLNTLMTAAGTDYFPKLEGKILLIEEMNAPLATEERPTLPRRNNLNLAPVTFVASSASLRRMSPDALWSRDRMCFRVGPSP